MFSAGGQQSDTTPVGSVANVTFLNHFKIKYYVSSTTLSSVLSEHLTLYLFPEDS